MKVHGSVLLAGTALAALALAPLAHATPVPSTAMFNFYGPSASGGSIVGAGAFSVAQSIIAGDPTNAYTIGAIDGVFSDSAAGLVNEPISGIVPNTDPAGPPSGDPAAPGSFNYLSVNGALAGTYDNLWYAGESPITCTGYPFSGGFLDVYGVAFTLKNGDVVDFWSNGDSGQGDAFYGVNLYSSDGTLLDSSPIPPAPPGVHADPSGIKVPEPGSLALLATALALAGGLVWRRREDAHPAA